MKIKFKTILLLICLTFAIPEFSYADAGLLVGRDYGTGDIDTTADVTNAQTQFSLAKYGYISSTNPTYTWMTGTQSGVKRVENSILFFSGHGNQNCMHFYNNDTTTDGYDFYITGTASYSSKTVRLASYDMSKVKLAVFAGCQTGSGTTNIASQTESDGASATIGWVENIEASSHTKWLNYFWSKFFSPSLSGNLISAIQYANSFTYSDSRVKNISTYGSLTGNFSSLSLDDELFVENLSTTSEVFPNDERKYSLNIDTSSLSESNKIDALESYIVKNIDSAFNSEEYNVEKTQSQNYNIYDITYVINGNIKTTLGYTIFEVDDKFVVLYDNTQGQDLSTLASNSLTQVSEYSDYSNILAEDLIDESKYTIEKERRYMFYDDSDSKIYYIISLDLIDKQDDIAIVKTFKYEV